MKRKPCWNNAITCLVLVLLWPWAAGAERNVSPGINDYYYDADFGDWVGVFERPGREVFDRRFQITAALELKPGMRVADIGAGTGLFTRLFARQVRPDGRVYAVDIAPDFVDNILLSARNQGLDNVQGVVNDQRGVGLPPDSIDVAFICDTYHHFEFPYKTMATVHKALRPGGRLIVVDFKKIPGVSRDWIIGHVRCDQKETTAEIVEASFELIDTPDIMEEQFVLRFKKK